MDNYHSTESKDFVRSNMAATGLNDPGRAWLLYEHEAQFIRKKLATFGRLGVKVVEHATRSDLAENAPRHADLIVIAHRKGERILGYDIPDENATRRMIAVASPEASKLLDADSSPSFLIEVLNRLVFTGTTSADAPRGLEGSAVVNRDHLSRHLGLRPGSLVELWDGLWPTSNVVDVFPPDFAGTIVFCICNSALVADEFSQQRPDSICCCNLGTTSAGLGLAKIHAALTSRMQSGKPLWLALNEVELLIDSIT